MRAWWRGAGCLVVLLALALARPAVAQPASAPTPAASSFTPAQRAEIVGILRTALQTDPSILRDAITALQQQESGAQDAAARAAISRAGPALARNPGDPVAGDPAGDVTLVEFYDLRCPYCRRMLPAMTELLAHDPKLRLVFKDIPVLGDPSVLGARAVLAAQRQGGYLKLQQALMSGSGQITEASVQAAATRLGLDWTRLRHDMDAPEVQARIAANLALAHELGIDGTPTYVVGSRLLPGAVPLSELQSAVAAARSGRGIGGRAARPSRTLRAVTSA